MYERTVVYLRDYHIRSRQSHRMKGKAEAARKNEKPRPRYLCIHCIQHYSSSQNAEASQVLANKRIDKQIAIYLYNRMLLGLQRDREFQHIYNPEDIILYETYPSTMLLVCSTQMPFLMLGTHKGRRLGARAWRSVNRELVFCKDDFSSVRWEVLGARWSNCCVAT